MNCRTESERFLGWQGGRGKIATGVAKATSRTILPRQRSQPKNKPLECKGILLEALRVILVDSTLQCKQVFANEIISPVTCYRLVTICG